jgi:RNA polymerase sigma-B factor
MAGGAILADEGLFAKKSDPVIRDQLILKHVGLARVMAKKFLGLGESLEDLVQEATIGLIEAVDRFDETRGTKFSTFAIPTILGELRRYFRDKCWVVKVPRRFQELGQQINKAEPVLCQKLGRLPTILEIADHLEVDEEQVLKAIIIRNAFRIDSLGRIVYEENGAISLLGDSFRYDDPGMEKYNGRDSDLLIALYEAINKLNEKMREVLYCRIWLGMTQDETAEKIKCSQMQVSRLEKSAKLIIRRCCGQESIL